MKTGANSLTPKKGGGQTKYDMTALVPVICERIAEGDNISTISQEQGMPSVSLWCLWTLEHAEVAEQYARARERRADARADRIDGYIKKMLTKEIDPQQCRVAIDAEKWQAGKENSKRYGEKVAVTGEDGGPILAEVKHEVTWKKPDEG